MAEAIMAFDAGSLHLQERIKIRFDAIVPPPGWEAPEGWEAGGPTILETTLGRALFNQTLPVDYAFPSTPEVDKKVLSAIVNDLAERYPKVAVAACLDALKEAGFHWATRGPASRCRSPTSSRPPRKQEILDTYETRAAKVQSQYLRGSDHRRRAPSGAHRDLDPGDQRGRQRDAEQPAEDELHLQDGVVRSSW
jgi:DNA-directed RNA polymerase subunit beta'